MIIVLLYLLQPLLFSLSTSKRFCCFLIPIAIIVSSDATSQVTADFTTLNSTTGCGSLVVEFQDLSTGNPTTWLWDFGNGNISNQQNPIAVYSNPGLYDVVLTVSDNSSSDIKLLNSFVLVNEEPVAGILSTSNLLGCSPVTIDFEDISFSNSTINNWQWDFGDGGSSIQQNPSYSYSNGGFFTIALIVTDVNGCQNMIIENNMVQVYNEPVSGFFGDILYSCNNFEMVSFNNTSINADSYLWDFGDGTTSNLQNPIHNYSSGLYSVELIVGNNAICFDTLSLDDYIEIGAVLDPVFITDTNIICEESSINFIDLTSDNPDSWLWDFGDGTTSNLQNPSHLYSNAGTYDVTLTTSKGGQCLNSNTVFGAIEVLDKPDINFTVDTSYSCSTPFLANFYDLTPNSDSWHWDFGNGVTSSLQNPSDIIFDTSGVYDINLYVTNSFGCENGDIFSSYIIVDKLDINISSLETSGCVPFSTDFLDLSSSIIPINNWLWNFGDGTTSNLENPSHHYVNTGNYNITLSAHNIYGCQDSKVFNNYIIVNDKPTTNFSASSIISCVGESIDFQDLSSPNSSITSWYWDFGDGDSSSFKDPTHQYQINGTYDISLVSAINGCYDTLLINDYIEIVGPTALFQEQHNCDNPLDIEFSNFSSGMDNILWDFGDGNFSNQLNPTHSFTNIGMYNVILLIEDTSNGCTNEFSKQVKVSYPEANFTYLVNPNNGLEDSVGCRPKRVYLQNLSQNFSHYKIIWEDGYIGYGRTDHFFDTVGTFDVTMIVTDGFGCKDTFTHYNMFTINDVKADFQLTNVVGCDSMIVDFQNLSMPASSVTWDFGDGGTSNVTNPQHIYNNEGFYDVIIYVESTDGCKDTLEKIEYIQFQYPLADFYSTNLSSCPGDSLYFYDNSSGINLNSYNWDFGDGTTSNLQDPSHIYYSNGLYDVSLTVIDSFGCPDTLMFNNYIRVEKPTSDFSYGSISSDCPPLISTFNNQSSNDVVLWNWDFGDGGNSLSSDPSHLYSLSGIFDVTLIVMNDIGCYDTIVQNNLINISGPTGNFSISDSIVCTSDSVVFTPIVLNVDSYFWDFGDGVYSNDSIPIHYYLNDGIYSPSLVLENNSGCQLTLSSPVQIEVNKINIDAGQNKSICLGDSVTLNASGSGNIFNWSPSSSLTNPNIHDPIAFPQVSTLYFVNHSDGTCDSYDSIYVEVFIDVPNPTFSTLNQCEGDTILFFGNSGTSSNNLNWSWSFDSSGQNTSNIFSPGSYSIYLIVENIDNSCSGSTTGKIEIFSNPQALFLSSEVCEGQPTIFEDMSSSNVIEWNWLMGDGLGVSNIDNPIYMYQSAGDYIASLQVISDKGCKSEISLEVSVKALPIAIFNNSGERCAEETMEFFDMSQYVDNDSIVSWSYDFGDNTNNATDPNPIHIYSNGGIYTVILDIISKNGCKSSNYKDIYVNELPDADFSINNLCLGDLSLFSDMSKIDSGYILSWNWDFGNLIGNSNIKDPLFVFPVSGDYNVSLTVSSNKGCNDSINKLVTIYELPNASFETTDSVCLGEEVYFSDMSLDNYSDITSWYWDFGDGNYSIEKNPTHVYTYSSIYNISLEVESSYGCKNDTLIKESVHVFSNPIADFSASSFRSSELNSSIEFYNTSIGGNSILWNFDNGIIDNNNNNPVIQFQYPGDYNITLTVSSDEGCIDSIIKIINIYPEFTFYIPDAFTPNGDGKNDYFKIEGNEIYNFKIYIYNRWGGLVFKSYNVDEYWDGTNINGNILQSGKYLYYVSLQDYNGRVWVYNGELNLIK